MGNHNTCCVSNRRLKTRTSGHNPVKQTSVSPTSEEASGRVVPMGRASSMMTRYKAEGQGNPSDGSTESGELVKYRPASGTIPSVPLRGPTSVSSDRRSASDTRSTSVDPRRSAATPAGPCPDTSKRTRNSATAASASPSDISDSRIAAMFARYRDPDDPDMILANGVESLCSDLNLRPDEFRVLILAWKMDAAEMCRISRSEFHAGCHALRTDSTHTIVARLTEAAKEIESDGYGGQFRDIYRWAYRFSLDKEASQRTLPVDMAVAMWRLVFSGCGASCRKAPEIVECWMDFLDSHPAIKMVPRDTWDMLLTFVDMVGNDLAGYNDEEAWPSMFDDFVEYENDRRNQNLVTDPAQLKESGSMLEGEDLHV